MTEQGSVFVYNVRGVVEKGDDFDGDDLCVSYCYTFGQDWQLLAGLEEGVSQTTRLSHGPDQHFVWNFPLDVTFSSTNPYGWPQLVLYVYGKDFFGTDIVRGYAAVHMPICPGQHMRRLSCFVPSSASLLQRIISWLTGNTPEFLDPKMVAQARGREVTRVESKGYINVTFNVTMKDFGKLEYDCGVVSLGSLATSSLLAAVLDSNDVSLKAVEQSRDKRRNFASDRMNSQGTDDREMRSKRRSTEKDEGCFEIEHKPSQRRGLFAQYPSGSSEKNNRGRGLVLVGNTKMIKDLNEPETSGTCNSVSSSKAIVHAVSSEDASVLRSISDEDESSANDTDDSKAKLHKDTIAKAKGVDNLAHEWDDPDGDDTLKKLPAKKKSSKKKQLPQLTSPIRKNNVSRRSSESGVVFTKDSGIKFVSSPDDMTRKNKGFSPKNAMMGSRDHSGSGRNVNRNDGPPAFELSSESATRKLSDGSTLLQGSTGTSETANNNITSLFSVNRNTPLPLARTTVLQPIGTKKPLPSLIR
ncbi:B9 domain [Trinorchestia longiramus]|nr:B9 domain [Trinorchestia longiramus]